jgi:hypothetical protein
MRRTGVSRRWWPCRSAEGWVRLSKTEVPQVGMFGAGGVGEDVEQGAEKGRVLESGRRVGDDHGPDGGTEGRCRRSPARRRSGSGRTGQSRRRRSRRGTGALRWWRPRYGCRCRRRCRGRYRSRCRRRVELADEPGDTGGTGRGVGGGSRRGHGQHEQWQCGGCRHGKAGVDSHQVVTSPRWSRRAGDPPSTHRPDLPLQKRRVEHSIYCLASTDRRSID